MRYLAMALGLCFASALLPAPVDGAARGADHGAVLVKAKARKARPRIKPHKAPKRHARRAVHGN